MHFIFRRRLKHQKIFIKAYKDTSEYQERKFLNINIYHPENKGFAQIKLTELSTLAILLDD